MASDLIDRGALFPNGFIVVNGSKPILTLNDLINKICNAKAVDAVEVVRCKECEFFWEYTEEHKATVENAEGDCAIRKWRSDDEQFCAVIKEDYCSLARRKEDAVD